MRVTPRAFAALAFGILLAAPGRAGGRLPDPLQDVAAAGVKGEQHAVLAGGCFWGVEAVFERLRGVSKVVSGYAGGSKSTARYAIVSMGVTSHAESVQISFDPSQISFGTLLKVFFGVAHDPTELNRQGPDEGAQYRSSIFYADDEQKRVAEACIRQLSEAKVFRRRIVTTVVPLEGFYPAEAYHQGFLDRNPTHPYIVYNDLPKLERLRAEFPELLAKKK